MRLLAVMLARVTAMTYVYEWDPRNKLFPMDFVQKLVERYSFQTFPKTLEDYRSPNGVAFVSGKMKDINIESITFYVQGVVVDTRSSTDDCNHVLGDLGTWISSITDVGFDEKRITRRYYLSHLAVQSDGRLEFLNPKLAEVSSWLTESVSKYAKQRLEFDLAGLTFQVDLYKHKTPLSMPMRIERLEGALFEENKYFSAAPLPTDEHISVLERFETALISSSAAPTK